MFRLLRQYPYLISFGVLSIFLTGFGQSFFLSLFTPYLLKLLDLSNSTFGLIYASATMASGLMIPWVGKKLNYRNPLPFMFFTLIGLSFFAFSFSLIDHWVHLWLTVMGLRFFGQGMCSHISSTVIATRFSINRGRALSLASLGFPANEALFPLIFLSLGSFLTVPQMWQVFAVSLLLLTGLAYYLLSSAGAEQEPDDEHGNHHYKEFHGYKSLTFWYYATPAILPPFLFTALFIYHGVLLESRGLSLSLMASSFLFFAISRFSSSLFAGVLVDHWGARKLFPWYLLPVILSLTVLYCFHSPLAFVCYLVLGAMTLGAASTIMNSVWSEIYGPEMMATVRSQMASLTVLSTAAGPFVFGYLIDGLGSVEQALFILIALMISFFLLAVFLKPLGGSSDKARQG